LDLTKPRIYFLPKHAKGVRFIALLDMRKNKKFSFSTRRRESNDGALCLQGQEWIEKWAKRRKKWLC
jgi:hypothetical protein